ncbi:hypothetical protein BB559_000394 [Furculomyces boomerangus]|uniref:Arrestin-like N-terminal domain-containing protein n=2 Tax=Harpellales TaxID=61421 RepID=A0A2T9Z5C4_9FUNG|nr:hypothetical protein BB559_000394 [Furculomyces boomerangus]PVZ99214.1 hypothetical protein BB558_004770 [Smittium angustum]
MFDKLKHPLFEIQVSPFNSEVFIESEGSKVPMSLITGIVSLKVKKPVHIKSITVSLKKSKLIEWADGLQITRIAYNEKHTNHQTSKTYVDTKNILRDILQEGYYEFPFFLWIPDNIEPSFKFNRCFIKYHLEATVNLMPNSSHSLKNMAEHFQTNSGSTPIMIHQVPKILKQYSWKVSEQLPLYINIYQKDNLKIVLMLQTRYLLSTKNDGPIKATLYIDYKPKKDDQKMEISCKEVTLTLTEEYRFFEILSAANRTESIILGKAKYNLENTDNDNSITTYNTSESVSPSPSQLSLSCNSSSTSTPTHSRPSSINNFFFKTPLTSTDTDPRISYDLFLPPFDHEPESNIASDNFSITQYLDCKVIIQFKSYEKIKPHMSIAYSENNTTIKNKVFSAKSVVYGIPECTEDYIYSLPSYQDINKNHLVY